LRLAHPVLGEGQGCSSGCTQKPNKKGKTMSKTSKLPTHRVYAVTKNGKKSYWKPIGAAWAHADGEGFSVQLEYLPLNGGEIVVRKPKPEAEADGNGGAQ